MSEFSIDRPPKAAEPSRSVDSSSATDADGGGGFTFLFHGGPGDDGKQAEEKSKPKPPLPIGPPVDLNLSSAARMDMEGRTAPGDFGMIGAPVVPPDGIASVVQQGLEVSKTLGDVQVDPSLFGPDGRLDLQA